MIKINTARIGEGGMFLEGEEDSSLLELESFREQHIVPKSDIVYKLHAVMVGQDLLITGKVHVDVQTECDRCLKAIKTKLQIPSVCLHFEKVEEKEIDITENIREDLLLDIPQRFICSEDCKGLCPNCGANLNRGKCECGRKKTKKKEDVPPEDSAWGELDKLKL